MLNEEIVKKLRSGICEVIFEKRDGTLRHMLCTLKDDLLPYISAQHRDESSVANDYLPVYDLEEGSWRAFKPSKLISITVTEEGN